MFLFLPFGLFRNPIYLLIIPFTLTGGIYREKLRKKYNFDVCRFGSLQFVGIAARDFDTRLFDCCSGHKAVKKSVFCFFCAPVRLSANASATGCNDFWYMLIMSGLFFPLIFIFGYIQRLHLRETYGLEPHPVADFFAWMCCYCCVLVQESKFVDHGFQAIREGTMNVYVPNPRVSSR